MGWYIFYFLEAKANKKERRNNESEAGTQDALAVERTGTAVYERLQNLPGLKTVSPPVVTLVA